MSRKEEQPTGTFGIVSKTCPGQGRIGTTFGPGRLKPLSQPLLSIRLFVAVIIAKSVHKDLLRRVTCRI